MKRKASMTLEEALDRETGSLAQQVLNYTKVMKDILDSAKDNPDFSADDWAPLAEMVDTENFERVGIWKEVVNWQQYVKLLTDWAALSHWEVRVRRITEQTGYAMLELHEFGEYKQHEGMKDEIFSLSVYEFNEDNKLVHLDIYMQREQVKVPEGTWETDSV